MYPIVMDYKSRTLAKRRIFRAKRWLIPQAPDEQLHRITVMIASPMPATRTIEGLPHER